MKVTFISFNDNRLTISTKSCKKGAVVQQPRVALLAEVIIIINNCVPASNTLEEHYVLAFLLIRLLKEKHHNFLCWYFTVGKEGTSFHTATSITLAPMP